MCHVRVGHGWLSVRVRVLSCTGRKNVYGRAGSLAHESFVFNIAVPGKLDMYNFDVWNLNQCQCKRPQPGMQYCRGGFPRWSINAFVFTRNVSQKLGRPVVDFDEPVVSMDWPALIAPHRVGMVGEALFVHCQVRPRRLHDYYYYSVHIVCCCLVCCCLVAGTQYTQQRASKPDFGMRDETLLPWYHELARQYAPLSRPYFTEWKGNVSLLRYYEEISFLAGERLHKMSSGPPRASLTGFQMSVDVKGIKP